MFRINLDHAKLVGLANRLANTRHRELRTGFDVLLHHLLEVHTVDVVGTDDHHNIRLHVFDDVDGLIDASAEPRYQCLPRRCWAGTGET